MEYRMRVHVFGNSPSPAVAIYGLHRSAQEGEAELGTDVRLFVERDFYVDDSLKSLPTIEAAVSLLKRTEDMLAGSKLRLHKIASNSKEVMKAFPSEDHANELKDLDLGTDMLPMQRSLSLNWDLKTDTFTFRVTNEEKPFTRRGVLSTVNSLYDPLGFIAPVTIQVESAELINAEIDIEFDATRFYTDSRVVLGYIYNETRRFYVYVNNRVQRIPDHATRTVPAAHLRDTTWFNGPLFLSNPESSPQEVEDFQLVEPALDTEVRPEVSTVKTTVSAPQLGSQRFDRFSSWWSLTRTIARLIHVAQHFNKSQPSDESSCKGWKLDPFIDGNGLLRVGGRIAEANLEKDEKNPLIIPGHCHISTLLVRHYHEATQHHGRLFTEGAIRMAGLWIVTGKRRISRISISVIYKCVICRKLRGTPQSQKMANLPADRLSIEPLFTNVGLDVFGPWSVLTCRTRGGDSNSKRWAVMFTCMSIRAVHIEVVASLDTSSFINALRRFLSIRGPVKRIRSDRGTNFVGACKELKVPSNDIQVQRHFSEQGCTWSFNSSHMGGAWERMIGLARRILDSMFLQLGFTRLTHETLTTLMAEVAAIMNARPLTSVSTDSADPVLLTPSTLLTQKVGTQGQMEKAVPFHTADMQ
ncbi:hypothetical protein SKAU_G00137670 [Synaphobranchus kaupii]|uniref:Integrase catalytic domain-containing protein n=1 Tax=Synaphobranchus kaupii TaxID=118154 RepID=A0A9Q1FSA1_SYNKA|nr:hypothetical protein SKAU_G00137670 [Synaphobranchus kaupii]